MTEKIESIITAVVDSVETEFHVAIKTDDAGPHYCVYIPHGTEVKKLRKSIFSLGLKKRCLIVYVPEGYIETFLRK